MDSPAAGVDLIKDDHSLADQTSAPFAERVERCQEAVVRANGETGGNALYFPNVTKQSVRDDGARGRRAACGLPWRLGQRAPGGPRRRGRDRRDYGARDHVAPVARRRVLPRRHGIAPEVLLATCSAWRGAMR